MSILKCCQCWDPSEDHGVCFTLGSPFANLPTDLIGLCISLSVITPVLKMNVVQIYFLRVLRKLYGS